MDPNRKPNLKSQSQECKQALLRAIRKVQERNKNFHSQLEKNFLENPPKKEKPLELIENLIGTMNRAQIVVTILIFATKIPMAMHLVGSGITLPGIQPVYCVNTNYSLKNITTEIVQKMHEEACRPDCPKIIVANNFWNRSIIGDYHLYCDRYIYRMVSQLLVMAGVFIGNYVFGYLSDKVGRKHPLMVCLLAQVVLGIWVAYSPTLESFLISKFLLCFFVGGTMVTGFVLLSECIGKKWRATIGILYMVPFCFGHLILPFISYICWSDWRIFQIAISVPNIIFVIGYWLIPESPRWLLAVGKVEECIKNCEKIAKFNGMRTEYIRDSIKMEAERRKTRIVLQKGNFLDLFKNGFMAFITIALYINWLGLTCSYYGMAQLASAFTDSFYANNILAAAIQLPAPFILCYTFNAWGRKYSHLFGNVTSAIACLVVAFTPDKYKIIPASIAMFALCWQFASIYVQTSELFPTTVRSIGVGSCSSIGRVGGMISPVFDYLKKFSLMIPPLIFASMLLLATILTMFVPETKGRDLPNTVEDVKMLKKPRKSISDE